MNYKLVLAFGLIAFLAGVSCQPSEEEKQLISKVFVEEGTVTPEECLKCLHGLKKIYADEEKVTPYDKLSDEQRSMRIVVNNLAAKGEISQNNCSKEKLKEFDYLVKYLRGYSPNAQAYLEFYKKKLAELCKV